MAASNRPNHTERLGQRPDGFFRLVAGLYATAFAVPPVITIAAGRGAGLGILYGLLLTTVVVVTGVVGWFVGSSRGLPERIGGTVTAWAAPLLPMGFVIPLVMDLFTAIDLPSALVVSSLFATVAGGLLGIGLVAMTHNRYTRMVLDGVAVEARWRAPWPQRERHLARIGAAVLVAASVGGFASAIIVGWPTPRVFQTTILLTVFLVVVTDPRNFAVTEVGLVTEYPLHRYIRPWHAYWAFTITDDVLVIHRRGWHLDIRCDPDEIEDLPAAIESLSRHLDQRDQSG